MINVLLADDHNIVRNGIKALLGDIEHINVVGEAENFSKALELIQTGVKTDIILTDWTMPGMAGVEFIQYLSHHFPEAWVIVLSMSDHENYVSQALQAGARGYLLKNVSKEELVFAISHVADGNKYICSELALRMIVKANHINDLMDSDMVNPVDFTKREMEVLKLMSEGLTNNEIADKLFTSRRTVEGHRQSLIEKTGVPNSAALIMQAVRLGILK